MEKVLGLFFCIGKGDEWYLKIEIKLLIKIKRNNVIMKVLLMLVFFLDKESIFCEK